MVTKITTNDPTKVGSCGSGGCSVPYILPYGYGQQYWETQNVKKSKPVMKPKGKKC